MLPCSIKANIFTRNKLGWQKQSNNLTSAEQNEIEEMWKIIKKHATTRAISRTIPPVQNKHLEEDS